MQLQMNVGFVPDKGLCDFMRKNAYVVQIPWVSMTLGGVAWLLDSGVTAVGIYGKRIASISTAAFLLLVMIFLSLLVKLRTDVGVALRDLYHLDNGKFRAE